MIENKLYIKLLSLKGVALRLSSLNSAIGWTYLPSDQSGLFVGYSPSAFFTGEQHTTDEAQKQNQDSLNGLKGAITAFQGSVKNLSDRLSVFSPGTRNISNSEKASVYINSSSKVTSESALEKLIIRKSEAESKQPGFSNSLFVNLKRDLRRGESLNEKPAGFHSFSKAGIAGNTSVSESIFTNSQKKTLHHFRDVTSVISNTSMKRERLLDTDLVRRIRTEKTPEVKPSYTIHQTFGDIVVQPGSLDVSMQQLKVKIHDILKQARDSMY